MQTQPPLPEEPDDFAEETPPEDGLPSDASSDMTLSIYLRQAAELHARTCCKLACSAKIQSKYYAEIGELHRVLDSMTKHQRDDFLWDSLRRSMSVKEEKEDRRVYVFKGTPICRVALRRLLRMGSDKFQNMSQAMVSGSLRPPEDMRKKGLTGYMRNADKGDDVDAFFNFLYHNVAEPLADADENAPELVTSELHAALCAGEAEEPQAALSAGGKTTPGGLLQWLTSKDNAAAMSTTVALVEGVGERRWLPHMSKIELYELYLFQGSPELRDQKARRSTFFRVFYGKGWSRLLKIREVAQHARCETCARLAKTVRTAHRTQDRQAAEQALRVHRLRNFADRAVDYRLSTLSEDSTSPEGGHRASRVLHIRVDGMDQAKFRCPRNLENSKGWANLWRPTLHCVGVVVEGVLEGYYITDQDVKKDSNLEITVLTLALDQTWAILKARGVTMPENLSLTYDNTAREGKNQHMAKWMSWLVAEGVFKSVQDGQGVVGHTHNKLDQRFSVVAAVLARERCLQTPEDFMAVIQQHVHPHGGRVLKVNKVESSWDWQEFFEPLLLSYSGIAASHTIPDVCHSKRFVTRRELPTLNLGSWNLQVPPVLACYSEHPDDVVLLTKEFWSSEDLAHPPLLVWPQGMMASHVLGRTPATLCPRNKLSEKQLQEFRKTAAKVKDEPWNLHAAAVYLTRWCDRNAVDSKQDSPIRDVLCWGFVPEISIRRRWQLAPLAVGDPEASDEWLRYAPGAPAAISLRAATAKRPHPTAAPAAISLHAAAIALPAAEEPSPAGGVPPLGGVEPPPAGGEEKRPPRKRPQAGGEPPRKRPRAGGDEEGAGQGNPPKQAPKRGPGTETRKMSLTGGLQGALEPRGKAADPAQGPAADPAEKPSTGCPSCRFSSKGCSRCNRPTYKPRAPRGPKARRAEGGAER